MEVDEIPPILKTIRAQASRKDPAGGGVESYLAGWREWCELAHLYVPDLIVADNFAQVALGDLSPGCQACKRGEWDCIFVTGRCNARCSFCYNPSNIPPDKIGSSFGCTPEEILGNHARTRITGISFSGGEPLLELHRLVSWAKSFTGEKAGGYYRWVYTNGLQATPQALEELACAGIDEIRFNLAASGYTHPGGMDTVRLACRLFERVTVEIPAITGDAESLLRALPAWSDLGVRHINLHELMYEPGTRSDKMAGPRLSVVLPDGHRTAIDPRSRDLILAALELVWAQKLPLNVNVCSLANKIHQVAGRRRSLLPLTQAVYEKLVDGWLLESFLLYHGVDEYRFIHPDQLVETRQECLGWRIARVQRAAPLSIHDSGRWIHYEELGVYE